MTSLSIATPPRFAPLLSNSHHKYLTLNKVYKKENESKQDGIGSSEITFTTSSDNYFSYIDDHESPVDEDTEESNYELFTTGLLISTTQTTYSLVLGSVATNSFIASTRFVDDILFLYDDSRVLEIAGIGLVGGIIASSLLLPFGFNVSASLFLAAPLFVCICGIVAKRLKRDKT